MNNNYLIEGSDYISINNKISEIIKKNNFSDASISKYDLSEDLGGEFTKIFEDVKKSFGGDAGIFKEIVNDKSI